MHKIPSIGRILVACGLAALLLGLGVLALSATPTSASTLSEAMATPEIGIKIVTGTVATNTGLPVVAAQIVARRIERPARAEALTDAQGDYSLELAPGLWALTVRTITDTTHSGWIYPLPPQLIFFHFGAADENRLQDFTVITPDSQVNGNITLPDGVSVPPFTVTIGLHNDEGVGRMVQMTADGTFSVTIPNGSYKVDIFPHDPGYLGPALAPVDAPVNGVADMGTITLLARDATLTGTVTADGAPLVGIPVIAWRPGVPGSLRTLTGPDGAYQIALAAGEWHVQPAPTALQHYLYPGSGIDLTINAGETVTGINFALTVADALITGTLVDEDGLPVTDVYGWVHAHQIGNPSIHNGAPILEGSFTLPLPAGEYRLAATLPPGAPYTSAADREVTVTAGETTLITLTVQLKDATITGGLWDPRNDDVVEGVAGIVGAWQPGAWVATPINPGNGSYILDVAAGLWRLNYRIDPSSDYVRLAGGRTIPVESEQNVLVPLPVTVKDAVITGTVLAPDGSALPGVVVLVKGVGGDVDNPWPQTRSDAQGNFELAVPYGFYRLGAALRHPTWVAPIEIDVDVLPGATSGGHVLQFQEPNAVLSGALTLENAVADEMAYVWAWSENGGFVDGWYPLTYTDTVASGPYHLDVISGTTWHIGAAAQTSGEYWLGRAVVDVNGAVGTQDLTLEGPYPLPGPVVVSFDSSEPQTVSLADGTTIYIPAHAMPVSGMVTLRILPIATLPRQNSAHVLDYGYAFLATGPDGAAIEANFNTEVTITFHYTNEQLAAQHVYEPRLQPAYYSTTTERWTFPVSFVVDPVNNQVVMQIDHFTDFALMGAPALQVYLPLAMR